jgi:hypothetical protein
LPLYLSPYIEAHKQAYYDAHKAAQQRPDWDAVVGFMADSVTGAVDELMTARAAFSALRATWETRGRFCKNSAALGALDLLGALSRDHHRPAGALAQRDLSGGQSRHRCPMCPRNSRGKDRLRPQQDRRCP